MARAAATAGAKLWLQPGEYPLPPRGDVRRILVIKVWAVGEYLMATPAFRGIRTAFPDADVTLLTGTALAPLAVGAAFFNKVWTVPESIFVQRRWRALWRLREKVRRSNFDLAFIFHHAREFSIFAAATGIPHRVGFDRAGDGFAHTVKIPYGVRVHQVEEYFDLARAAGATGEPGPLAVTPDDAAVTAADAAMAATGLGLSGRPFIVIAPGGGINAKTKMTSKRWPPQSYAQILRRLSRDFDTALVGSPSDQIVTTSLKEAATADLTAALSLPALYVLLQRAQLFIGNDSAPMHLAAAAGTPTVAFFGPTDPALNGPWGTKALILTAPQPCQPCYKDGYFPTCRHISCLASLSPETALAAIYEFLDSIPAR